MSRESKAPRGRAGRMGRGALALAAGGLLLAFFGCSGDRDGAAGADPEKGPWNLVFITMDTTRSDRLGCYGYEQPTSPAIDALAQRGIVFEHAISPVPITLPSHATMLTGLDPHEHGVRNNSTFLLGEEFTTIAEILAEHGYATGATLGAFPVDGRFGLGQGFETYDDEFSPGGSMPGVRMTQRDAADVTSRALQWIGRNREKKFFHWAHYFDPHFPWEPPPPFRDQFADLYNAEVAFMDSEIGRLAQGLDEMGLGETTWLVLAADHGESLEEHGELTHSFLIYGATQRVPCIVVPPRAWKGLPADQARGRRIGGLARLKDVFPTMLDALGFAGEKRGAADSQPGDASSLLALAAGTQPAAPYAYMETLAPALEFGWCGLHGVRTGDWSYIRAPEPELYDLQNDPAELHNVYDAHREIAKRLAGLCDQILESEVELKLAATDQETMDKLRGLGYAAAPVAALPLGPDVNDKNPKDLIHLERRITEAIRLKSEYKPDDSRKILEEVLEEDPENPYASRMLIELMVQLGENEATLPLMNAHIERYPDDWNVLTQKAQCLAIRGDFDASLALLEDILARNPAWTAAAELYPRVLVEAGRVDEARTHLEKAAAGAADADARARLAFFEFFQDNPAKALEHANAAITAEPGHAGGHAVLGEILFRQAMRERNMQKEAEPDKLFDEARGHLEKALAADPLESLAAYRMGFMAHLQKDLQQARNYYQAALARRPNWPEVHARLADVLWKLRQYKPSLQHFHQAYTYGFREAGFLLNFGNALGQAGQKEAALAVWQEALDANPPPQMIEMIKANMEKLKSLP